jgi:hypothetical protein
MQTNFPSPKAPDKELMEKLLLELSRLFNSIDDFPIGMIASFPTGAVPTPWLLCNGATFSAASYPYLARVYPTLVLPTISSPFGAGTVAAIRGG